MHMTTVPHITNIDPFHDNQVNTGRDNVTSHEKYQITVTVFHLPQVQILSSFTGKKTFHTN